MPSYDEDFRTLPMDAYRTHAIPAVNRLSTADVTCVFMYVHGEVTQCHLPSRNLPLRRQVSLTCKLPSPLQPTPAALYSTADAVVGAGEERQWWSVKAPLMELTPRGDGGGIGNGDGMDASL